MSCKSCQKAREEALAALQYANPPVNPSTASIPLINAMTPINREPTTPPPPPPPNFK